MLPQVKSGVKGFVEVPLWDRIKARTEIGDCHLWTGHKVGGYASIYYKGRDYRLHRLLWEMAYGPIPKGLFVCHSCDVRNCIKLSHLWLGTNKDNLRDASAKGRLNGSKQATLQSHCKNGHEYTPENTRVGYSHGKPCRRCLACLKVAWTKRNGLRKHGR